MNNIAGMKKPELQVLPHICDRMTFLYLEHCQINREDSAITVKDEDGVVHVPAAVISVLLLGPGTSITHRAMELIGDAGVTIVWVGEKGVRFYASGRPLTHRSHLLIKQAELVSNQRTHLAVARKMYSLRFPEEDVSTLSMQQLRGREGSRIKALYHNLSQQWNVPWRGRDYNPDDFLSGDPINQALSAGNVCLYGLAHAVIAALGCSPGLGFVHIGHERSFVYDIGDLYKAEISIPIAFEIASQSPPDLPSLVRKRVRDEMFAKRILERMVHDIQWLFMDSENVVPNTNTNIVHLWDNVRDFVQSGRNYEEF